MHRMIDGDDDSQLFGQMTMSCPSKDKLNQIFMNQNIYGERLNLVHHVCNENINEINLQNHLLNKHRFLPAGWSLEFRPMSQDNFYAHASRISSCGNNYEISYTLGIPATLLSIAIELDSSVHVQEYVNNNRNSINDWFPHVRDKNQVSQKTIDWVLDACLLLYFHEVSHVMFGHCDYKEQSNNEARVLEMDADFNSGSMFGIYLQNLSKDGRRAESGMNTVTRAIKAGFLLGVALKALSARSEKYHFPTSRVMSFYAGCIYSLTHSGELLDFDNLSDGDNYYGALVSRIRDPLLISLRKCSLKYFAGTEEEIDDDYQELISVTAPLRDKLKDGPLKNLTVPLPEIT